MSEFSIKTVVNQSLGLMMQHIGRIFAVTIMVALAFGIFVVLFSAVLPASLFSLFIFFALILLFMTAAGAVFNYWVRIGALGLAAAALPRGQMLKAGFVNGLKFGFIGILLLLVTMLVMGIFSLLGMDLGAAQTPPFDPSLGMEQLFSGVMDAMAQQTMNSEILAYNLTALMAICFVYALFSANLTKTALQDMASGYETPHVADFAVALILIYFVAVLPGYLLIWMDLFWVSFIYQLVVGIPIGAAIGFAHGVRHRLCAPVDSTIEYQ